jgi:NAD-dependent protein deacetylase/lipoamidase
VVTSADLAWAAAALGEARTVVVFTGAGISAESGVPTFRDDLTGLWARFDPGLLATPEAFAADPDLVWGWYEWRRARVLHTHPNPGHFAVATIRVRVPGSVLVTQNVDDLHERAGWDDPIHLHGSLFAPRCSSCAALARPSGPPAEQPPEGQRVPPPRCEGCGGAIRPGVVWFGEALPTEALDAALDAAASCDVLLAVGTSGVVHPAAEIPEVATRFGATVIQVNPQETALDAVCAMNLRGPAAHVLPRLVEAAWDSPLGDLH